MDRRLLPAPRWDPALTRAQLGPLVPKLPHLPCSPAPTALGLRRIVCSPRGPRTGCSHPPHLLGTCPSRPRASAQGHAPHPAPGPASGHRTNDAPCAPPPPSCLRRRTVSILVRSGQEGRRWHRPLHPKGCSSTAASRVFPPQNADAAQSRACIPAARHLGAGLAASARKEGEDGAEEAWPRAAGAAAGSPGRPVPASSLAPGARAALLRLTLRDPERRGHVRPAAIPGFACAPTPLGRKPGPARPHWVGTPANPRTGIHSRVAET